MLNPINLHTPTDFAELHRQRLLCGWHHTEADLLTWRNMSDAGTKSLFWITHSSSPSPVGHISLDSVANPPDPCLARPDKSLLTICTFFILPEFRRLGLGRRAVEAVEGLARREEACRAIALTALSKRYLEEPGAEVFRRMGKEVGVTEGWYERLGYWTFKEEAITPERLLDGTEIMLVEAFMRKEL